MQQKPTGFTGLLPHGLHQWPGGLLRHDQPREFWSAFCLWWGSDVGRPESFPSLVTLVSYSLIVRGLTKPEETLTRVGNAAQAKSLQPILMCNLFTLCSGPFSTARSFYLTLCFLPSQDCQLLMVASLTYTRWKFLCTWAGASIQSSIFCPLGTRESGSFRNWGITQWVGNSQ